MKDPKMCKTIEEVRESIDLIDYQILKLFSERYGFVKEIVRFKTDEESVVAKERQEEVIQYRRKWAEELGLNPDLFEKIFNTLIQFNVQRELEILKSKEKIKH